MAAFSKLVRIEISAFLGLQQNLEGAVSRSVEERLFSRGPQDAPVLRVLGVEVPR